MEAFVDVPWKQGLRRMRKHGEFMTQRGVFFVVLASTPHSFVLEQEERLALDAVYKVHDAPGIHVYRHSV
ncbi:MAG: hypothetical protein HKN13_00410 [Rhodothermales bacterium]|nr:hypothetical protein [Rhodothermales bacterium]